MEIKTKPFMLQKNFYIKLCHKLLLKKYKWIALAIIFGVLMISLFTKFYWINIISLSVIILFYLFWASLFYSITKVPQTAMLFEKYSYTITHDKILAMIDARRGMVIPWEKIKKYYNLSHGIVLELTQSHIIYLPYKIFKNDFDINFTKSLLKKNFSQ